MISLHNQKNISKSQEPKKKMLNKKRRSSNVIEESNQTLDETHNINQRKIHKKDNSIVKKEQNKFPKRWKGGKRRRNNSKLSPKKEKFINITKEINKPNTKGLTINEENEESESSKNIRVIYLTEDDDNDENERKGRRKKNPSVIKMPSNIKEESIKKEMIFTFLNNKINKLGNELNKKIYLLSEIYKESEIYIKKLGKNYLDTKSQLNQVLNTYKVLYIRKICNIIIKELIDRYKDNIALTKTKFKSDNGPDFSLTVVFKDILKISKSKITAVFDFLWKTQQNCSKLIHFNDVKFPIIKEIFYSLINEDIKDKNKDTLVINIKEMVKLLFENIGQSELNINNESSDKINILDKYIKEEEIKLSDNGKMNLTLNINDDDEIDYSKKIEKIMTGKYEGNIEITNLLKILKNKLMFNQREINKFLISANNTIEPDYFYNLWISSFNSNTYKKSNEYKRWVKLSDLPSIQEIKNIIITLLLGFEINFLDFDPIKLTENVQYII